jgi:hypothetical protein
MESGQTRLHIYFLDVPPKYDVQYTFLKMLKSQILRVMKGKGGYLHAPRVWDVFNAYR